jgi:hypothetical protein
MAVTNAASSASGDLERRGDCGRCVFVAGRSIRMDKSRLGGSLVPGGSRVCRWWEKYVRHVRQACWLYCDQNVDDVSEAYQPYQIAPPTEASQTA